MSNTKKQEKQYPKGIYVKASPSQMEWMLCKISINRDKMIEWLQSNTEDWVNLNVCKSQNTNEPYAVVDTWKPDPNYKKGNKTQEPKQEQSYFPDGLNPEDVDVDEIPFN